MKKIPVSHPLVQLAVAIAFAAGEEYLRRKRMRESQEGSNDYYRNNRR